MPMQYHRHVSTRKTPQSEPIPGRPDMVADSAGGFTWAVDDWQQLDRFLILGTEGGTYYINERKLTRGNAEAVIRCIQSNGERAVNRIVEISDSGRAPQNDPALFALALAASIADSADTRRRALDSLPKVARIGTHLFTFLTYAKAMRGWGRTMRRAVGRWYTGRDSDALAYQLIKYRQRDGWTHADALRLAHPKAPTLDHDALFAWATDTIDSADQIRAKRQYLPALILAYEAAQHEGADLPQLIRANRLPREALPTEALTKPKVWEALLEEMPMMAMVRNLANMTRLGLVAPLSEAARTVAERLGDKERILKARVHPMALLVALKTYQSGGHFSGSRSKYTWEPVSQVVDALDAAFYLAFGNVVPVGRPLVLALDVSGSMSAGWVAGAPVTPREAAAAMALVTASVEPSVQIISFQHEIVPFEVSPRERLDVVVRRTQGLPFGRTDCAQPMIWAERLTVGADGFVIYTDSETWSGAIHPAQALDSYRRKSHRPAKLVVVALTANPFTIADPTDSGMLDCVGFDTATPNLISDFLRG